MVSWDPHRPLGVLATEDLSNHGSFIMSYLFSLFLWHFIYLLAVVYILKCNLAAARRSALTACRRPWPEPWGRSAPNEHHQGWARSSRTWNGFKNCTGKETPSLTPVPHGSDLPGNSPELQSKHLHRAFSISSLPHSGPVLSWRHTKAPEPGRAVPQPGSSPSLFFLRGLMWTQRHVPALIFLQVRWASSQEAEEGSPFCSRVPKLHIHVSGGSFGGCAHSSQKRWELERNGWWNTK